MVLQAVGIGLHPVAQGRLPLCTGQQQALGEGLEMDAKTPPLLEAEHQVDGAGQDAGQGEGAEGKGGRLAEKIGPDYPLLPRHRGAIPDDHHPLPRLYLLLEQDGGVGPHLLHLDEIEAGARVDLLEQGIEARRVTGEHQGIDAHLAVPGAERPAQLEIPEVGAEQQQAAARGERRLIVFAPHQLDLFGGDVAAPARQLVQRRLAKAQEVAKAGSRSRGQWNVVGRRKRLEPGQILLRGRPLAAPGQPEVADDGVEQRLEAAPAEQPIAGQHDLHAEPGAPLGGA
ncbi:hypothetical protein D3C79_782570 [compost metagenome]